MDRSQKSRNLQLREREKVQEINVGSLTVSLHVPVLCGISSSFWLCGRSAGMSSVVSVCAVFLFPDRLFFFFFFLLFYFKVTMLHFLSF